MKNIKYLILIIFFAASFSNSSDKENHEDFYQKQKLKLIKEYRACTGDTSDAPAIERLLLWKSVYNKKSQSEQYNKILTQYIAWSGKTSGISPCEVFKWYLEKTNNLLDQEDSLVNKMIGHSEFMLDSLIAHSQLENIKPSKFDFAKNIRFGLSRRNFNYLFNSIYKKEPLPHKDFLIVRHFILAGFPYTLAFKFDKKGLLYQYEIEGNPYNAESLNSCVHPELKRLTNTLEKKFGEASHYNRIGYFDIKPGALSPFARWQADGFRINTGIAVHEGQYYAKAIVTDILQYKKSLKEINSGIYTDNPSGVNNNLFNDSLKTVDSTEDDSLKNTGATRADTSLN